MFLELNITNDDRLLITDQAVITSLNICNTGSSDATMSLYKQVIGGTEKFYFLKGVSIKQQYAFLAENMGISTGDELHVVIAGTCSVIIDFA